MRVPFAAYPLHPVTCARIIGYYAVFHVETSGPALARSLRRAGLAAQWVVPPRSPHGTAARPGRHGHHHKGRRTRTSEPSRTLQRRRSELDRNLIELLDQNTRIEGIRYLLADYHVEGRPWPHYRGEDQVWP